jgi:4-azaleucine resistance transporter AzlC
MPPSPATAPEAPGFGLAGLRLGAAAAAPVALGVAVYGLVYGMLAGQAGMTLAEAGCMSALVFAGASQFVALDMWVQPLPVAALARTALVVNLRHVLMGAALGPHLAGAGPLRAYGSMFFLVDEGFALAAAYHARGGRGTSFLLGTGLVLHVAWLGSTLAGHAAGALVPDPARYGLDFAFTAAFLALLAGLWRGRGDAAVWLAAAGAAVAGQHLLPGKWYILAGGLAGGLVGLARPARRAAREDHAR